MSSAAMFSVLYYVSQGISLQVTPNFWWYFFSCGLFGIGVIVPGMTSSSVLMALGLYESVLAAMAELNIPVLLAIAAGVVLAVLLPARLANWVFRRYNAPALHGILGIVLASTILIVPVSYTGVVEVLLCAACCGGGYFLARLMETLDRRSGARD